MTCSDDLISDQLFETNCQLIINGEIRTVLLKYKGSTLVQCTYIYNIFKDLLITEYSPIDGLLPY